MLGAAGADGGGASGASGVDECGLREYMKPVGELGMEHHEARQIEQVIEQVIEQMVQNLEQELEHGQRREKVSGLEPGAAAPVLLDGGAVVLPDPEGAPEHTPESAITARTTIEQVKDHEGRQLDQWEMLKRLGAENVGRQEPEPEPELEPGLEPESEPERKQRPRNSTWFKQPETVRTETVPQKRPPSPMGYDRAVEVLQSHLRKALSQRTMANLRGVRDLGITLARAERDARRIRMWADM